MKQRGLILILSVLAAGAVAQTFTDINSPQYYGKTDIQKAYTAIDANFAKVEAGAAIAPGTLTVSGDTTLNDDLIINLGAAAEEITIAQTNTVGVSKVPCIKITDARTGTNANEPSEGTLVITSSGTYAVLVSNGIVRVDDEIDCIDDLTIDPGGGDLVVDATIDATALTIDAAAGVDAKTSGAITFGSTTATSTDIGKSGTTTTIKGALNVDQGTTLDTTLGVAGDTTLSDDLIVNLGALDEEIVITQTNTVGASGVPCVKIADARTGANANATNEATVQISAAGSYALAVVDGDVSVADNMTVGGTLTSANLFTTTDTAAGSWTVTTTLGVGGDTTLSDDLIVNLGALDEEITIAQTNTVGASGVPCIKVTDARTGANANATNEATLQLSAAGSYALAVVDGDVSVADAVTVGGTLTAGTVTATTLNGNGTSTFNDEIVVNLGALDEEITIAQTNTVGASGVPCIKVTDARTGANANATNEATLQLSAAGSYALAVVDGDASIADNLTVGGTATAGTVAATTLNASGTTTLSGPFVTASSTFTGITNSWLSASVPLHIMNQAIVVTNAILNPSVAGQHLWITSVSSTNVRLADADANLDISGVTNVQGFVELNALDVLHLMSTDTASWSAVSFTRN